MFESPDFSAMDARQLVKAQRKWKLTQKRTGEELTRLEHAASIDREQGKSLTDYVSDRMSFLRAENTHAKRQLTRIAERKRAA